MGPEPILRLTAWLSPSFPIGAYSYSHGIEYAVEIGRVKDLKTLVDWVSTILRHGAGRLDAAFFLEAYRASSAKDWPRLDGAAEMADAMRGTAETALESSAQGTAFLTTLRAAWPHEMLDEWASRLEMMDRAPSYGLAVGVAASLAGVDEANALALYLHALAANLVSASVRLVPLGQTDGQRAIAALEPVIIACTQTAVTRSYGDLGAAAPVIDWTSMQHETQYTRLFRS